MTMGSLTVIQSLQGREKCLKDNTLGKKLNQCMLILVFRYFIDLIVLFQKYEMTSDTWLSKQVWYRWSLYVTFCHHIYPIHSFVLYITFSQKLFQLYEFKILLCLNKWVFFVKIWLGFYDIICGKITLVFFVCLFVCF